MKIKILFFCLLFNIFNCSIIEFVKKNTGTIHGKKVKEISK